MVTIRLFTHSIVTTRMKSTTTLSNLNYSNQKISPKEPETASLLRVDLVLGLVIKLFSLTGLSSIMPRTLPYRYNVLKALVWKVTASLNFLNVSSVCSSSLLTTIIKKMQSMCAVSADTNISSNFLFLFLY